MPLAALREFLKLEAAGGIVLILASALAIALANSPIDHLYQGLLETYLSVSLGSFALSKPLVLWINDGLMAIFFLLVGLEIKREFLDGELSRLSQVALPAVAAVGGMAIPALLYVAINLGTPDNLSGWAIPAATDIAFALGLLALIGARAPLSLKVLLMAIAVIDDLGAILIIALFYSAELSILHLVLAIGAAIGLFAMNRFGVTRIAPYVLIGVVLWVCVLKSGVHATLAGVIVAMAIPLRAADEHGESPLRHLEHTLHPWVAFGVLPVFGFANAGVSFAGMTVSSLWDPLTLGISAGLFLGKQIGVFGAIWLTVKAGWSRLPSGAGWAQIYGVAALCGVGFTMSLFIGGLAFEDPTTAAPVRLGVLSGSILAGAVGFLVLRFGPAPSHTHAQTPRSAPHKATDA